MLSLFWRGRKGQVGVVRWVKRSFGGGAEELFEGFPERVAVGPAAEVMDGVGILIYSDNS